MRVRLLTETSGHDRRRLPVFEYQVIDDFSAHQTPPTRHPDFPARGHIHKMIHHHGSLTSRTLHRRLLTQQVMATHSARNMNTLRDSPCIHLWICQEKVKTKNGGTSQRTSEKTDGRSSFLKLKDGSVLHGLSNLTI